MSIITVDVFFMRPQTGNSLSLMLSIFCSSWQVIHVSFRETDSQSNNTSIWGLSQCNRTWLVWVSGCNSRTVSQFCLACMLHRRLLWYPWWNDPCVTGAVGGQGGKGLNTGSISWKESSETRTLLLLSFLIKSSSAKFTLSLKSSLNWCFSQRSPSEGGKHSLKSLFKKEKLQMRRIRIVHDKNWYNVLMPWGGVPGSGFILYLGNDGGIWSITLRFLAESSTLAPW